MSAPSVSREEFDALRAEVAELKALLQSLQRPSTTDEVDAVTLHVLAAAVAAYLGKRATIKFVRRLNPDETDAWKAQGRVVVAAGRQLPKTRGW